MLTNKAIARKIFETLRDSQAVFNKCWELYSKPHSVYLGYSGTMAPPPERCPAFQVVSWHQERGEHRDGPGFTFSVLLALEDRVRESGILTRGVYTEEHEGPEALEDLLALALAAIKAALPELNFDDLSLDFEAMEYYPLFVAEMMLTLSYPALIGGFEPTL